MGRAHLYSKYFQVGQPDQREGIHFLDESGEFRSTMTGKLVLAVSWELSWGWRPGPSILFT